MKKPFTILFLSTISISVFGQFEWVYENTYGDDYLHQMIRTKGGEYALLHGYDSYPVALTVLDGNGNKRFDYFAGSVGNNVEVISFNDMIEMPGNPFSLLAEMVAFDPMSGNATGYQAILQLDDNGTLVNIFEIFSLYSERGVSLSNGSYILMGLSYPGILKKTVSGDDLWEKSLSGYNIYDIVVTTADTILIATAQGLLTLDEDGNQTGLHSGIVFDQIKVDEVDGIVGTMGDSIFLLSTDYSLLASTGYAGDNIKDFSVEGNKVAVLTESGQVYQYDSLLTFLDSFPLFNDGEFDFISIGPERLVLSGIEQYGGPDYDNSIHSVFAKEYSFEGDDYGISNDIGVVGIEQGAETEVTETNPPYHTVAFKDVKITVRNFGDNPVESLYLHTKQGKNKKFENLNLLPGEEVDLIWDEIKFSFSFNPAGLTLDLCIWTSHPDILMDLDAGNDTRCSDFLVSNEDVQMESNIVIYPNPTSDYLNFQLQSSRITQHTSIRIADINGQVLRTFDNFMPNATHIVPVWEWPSGIYILQYLEDGHIMASEKFVVAK